MSTQVVWAVPAYSMTPTLAPVSFDLTDGVRTILRNPTHERIFKYGEFHAHVSPDNVVAASVVVQPKTHPGGHLQRARVVNTLSEFVDWLAPSGSQLDDAKLDNARNLLVFSLELGEDVPVSSDPMMSDLERDQVPRAVAVLDNLQGLMAEIGALYRAAVHLTFFAHHELYHDYLGARYAGGLFALRCEDTVRVQWRATSQFTFPVVFEGAYLPRVADLIRDLASHWHKPLWPIFRYLRAVESEQFQMDDLLNLLFALEGLFDQNTSTDVIRLSCVATLAPDRRMADSIDETLRHAFRLRNDIVHGAKVFTGSEPRNTSTGERLTQEFFYEVRDIVGAMLNAALRRMNATPDAAHLRVSRDSVQERLFPGQ